MLNSQNKRKPVGGGKNAVTHCPNSANSPQRGEIAMPAKVEAGKGIAKHKNPSASKGRATRKDKHAEQVSIMEKN